MPELSLIKDKNRIIEEVIKDNDLLWAVVRFLIFTKLTEFFIDRENIQISKKDNIYRLPYFQRLHKANLNDIRDFTDLTFPKPEIPLKIIFPLIILTIGWIILIVNFLSKNPDILFSTVNLIIFFVPIIIFLPILVIHFISPKTLKISRFKDIKNFNDLVDHLFTLNLYRYRINNFERLKSEMQKYS